MEKIIQTLKQASPCKLFFYSLIFILTTSFCLAMFLNFLLLIGRLFTLIPGSIDGWLGYWGGIIGAVLSAIVTLSAIFLDKQFVIEKEKEILVINNSFFSNLAVYERNYRKENLVREAADQDGRKGVMNLTIPVTNLGKTPIYNIYYKFKVNNLSEMPQLGSLKQANLELDINFKINRFRISKFSPRKNSFILSYLNSFRPMKYVDNKKILKKRKEKHALVQIYYEDAEMGHESKFLYDENYFESIHKVSAILPESTEIFYLPEDLTYLFMLANFISHKEFWNPLVELELSYSIPSSSKRKVEKLKFELIKDSIKEEIEYVETCEGELVNKYPDRVRKNGYNYTIGTDNKLYSKSGDSYQPLLDKQGNIIKVSIHNYYYTKAGFAYNDLRYFINGKILPK